MYKKKLLHKSINSGYKNILNFLTVSVPSSAVFLFAVNAVSRRSMDQKNYEKNCRKYGRYVVNKRHHGEMRQDVTQVIGMTHKTPQSRNQKLLALGRRYTLQICTEKCGKLKMTSSST